MSACSRELSDISTRRCASAPVANLSKTCWLGEMYGVTPTWKIHHVNCIGYVVLNRNYEQWIKWYVEEVVTCLNILSQHLPTGTETNYKSLSKYSWSGYRESKVRSHPSDVHHTEHSLFRSKRLETSNFSIDFQCIRMKLNLLFQAFLYSNLTFYDNANCIQSLKEKKNLYRYTHTHTHTHTHTLRLSIDLQSSIKAKKC
jgi:hypothetical protein